MLQRNSIKLPIEWVFISRTPTPALAAFATAFAASAASAQIRVVLGTPDWEQLFDEEPSLCKDKNPTNTITLTDVRDAYVSDDFPYIVLLLRSGSHCIGFAMFHVTHFSPSFELMDTSLYMYISYLCGSRYRGVGSAIIALLREYRRFIGASICIWTLYPGCYHFMKNSGLKR